MSAKLIDIYMVIAVAAQSPYKHHENACLICVFFIASDEIHKS